MSLGIWMLFNYYFFPPTTKSQVKPENTSQSPSPQEIEKVPETKIDTPTILQTSKPEEIKKFFIKTDSFLVELSSLGGRIEHYYIKNYKHMDGSDVLIAKDDSSKIEFNGETYNAVEVSRERGFDFTSLENPEDAYTTPLKFVNFNSIEEKEINKITFESKTPDSRFLISKVYHFFPKENYFKFNYIIKNISTTKEILASPDQPLYFRSFGSLGPFKSVVSNDRDQVHYFRYYYLDGSFKDSVDSTNSEGFFSNLFSSENKNKKFSEIKEIGNGIDFFGVGSRYFIAVLDPLNHNPNAVIIDNRDGNTTGILAKYENIVIQPGESHNLDFAAYVGIREEDGMEFRDSSLSPTISESPFKGLSEKLNKSFNQGLTTPFRNGIVWLFKKMYSYLIPNYGWCIITLSLLLKLAFYPLNQKQAESMKKMQELNPLIQEINTKYDKDPALKQQKIMELYKKHNANPVGGCLPMLIQIPIFIALYTAFSDTIDLWKSPFLWVNDLSEPDTVWTSPMILGSIFNLNLLPIIMVITQIIQTKMTSVSTDPNQKVLMYTMPVIMIFFFWSMPSGVTLYWTTQNFFSIAQQYYTNNFVELKKQKKEATVVIQSNNTPQIRQHKGPRKGKK